MECLPIESFIACTGLSLEDEKDKEPSDVVIFKSQNFFALQRFIWFFADAPHLIKTSRGKYKKRKENYKKSTFTASQIN